MNTQAENGRPPSSPLLVVLGGERAQSSCLRLRRNSNESILCIKKRCYVAPQLQHGEIGVRLWSDSKE